MSVTRMHADFFPFTNSERGRELIGCKIDSLVFELTFVTGLQSLELTVFTSKSFGILKIR